MENNIKKLYKLTADYHTKAEVIRTVRCMHGRTVLENVAAASYGLRELAITITDRDTSSTASRWASSAMRADIEEAMREIP